MSRRPDLIKLIEIIERLEITARQCDSELILAQQIIDRLQRGNSQIMAEADTFLTIETVSMEEQIRELYNNTVTATNIVVDNTEVHTTPRTVQ